MVPIHTQHAISHNSEPLLLLRAHSSAMHYWWHYNILFYFLEAGHPRRVLTELLPQGEPPRLDKKKKKKKHIVAGSWKREEKLFSMNGSQWRRCFCVETARHIINWLSANQHVWYDLTFILEWATLQVILQHYTFNSMLATNKDWLPSNSDWKMQKGEEMKFASPYKS